MNESQGDQKELIEALHRFSDRSEKLLSMNTSSSNNTINMGSGERGIWICVCLCCMMLVALVMGGSWMSREFTRYDIALSERKEEADRSQTYLSSIFGRMPQWMREEVEKEASAKLKEKEKKDALR